MYGHPQVPPANAVDVRSMSQECCRRRCLFQGRVQGVGFRYTVKNIAMQHDVVGFVRNLPDGSVELVVEGPSSEIDQVLNAVKSRMNDYIRKVDVSTLPATGEFEQFHIRH